MDSVDWSDNIIKNTLDVFEFEVTRVQLGISAEMLSRLIKFARDRGLADSKREHESRPYEELFRKSKSYGAVKGVVAPEKVPIPPDLVRQFKNLAEEELRMRGKAYTGKPGGETDINQIVEEMKRHYRSAYMGQFALTFGGILKQRMQARG